MVISLLKHKYILIVFLLSIISVSSLLHPGFYPSHDGEYHIIRFYEFDKVLRDGNLYPRWAPDLNFGFGVPLFNYVYPLPNYVASFFHFFGVSFIDAFKFNIILAVAIGAIFFYFWNKEFWGELGGLVGAIFYIFSPYYFVDIYIRGSVGEVWALGLFPAFLWSVTKAISKDSEFYLPISGIFLALIIFSHNILAFGFFPFALSYMGFLIYLSTNKILKVKKSLFIILLGLGLSAVFWLPAIYEVNYTTGLQIFDLKRNFAEIYQLLIPSWGSGFFGTGLSNEMSIQIGVANLFALVISFFAGLLLWKKKDKKIKLMIFSWLWFFILSFLMIRLSAFIWDFLPFMNYFQFPWRLLSILIITTSFLAGSILYIYNSKILAFAMILFAVLLTLNYAHPDHYFYRSDNYYLSRANFMDGTNSPGNVFNTIWIKGKFSRQAEKARIINTEGNIIIDRIKSTRYDFVVNLKNNGNIIINTSYFPGWVAYVDNKPVITRFTENGLIEFNVLKGKHFVKMELTDTFVRKIGGIISSLAILSILLFIVKSVYLKHT